MPKLVPLAAKTQRFGVGEVMFLWEMVRCLAKRESILFGYICENRLCG